MFQPTINKGLFTLAALALLPALVGAALPASNTNPPFAIGCAVSVILWVGLGLFAFFYLISENDKAESPRHNMADDLIHEYLSDWDRDSTWRTTETKLVPAIAPGARAFDIQFGPTDANAPCAICDAPTRSPTRSGIGPLCTAWGIGGHGQPRKIQGSKP